MAKLVKFEVKELPKLCVVGKELRYNMEKHMQGDNRIPAFWEACFANETFSTIEKQVDYVYDPAYIGIMMDWDKGDDDFSYICGMLMKEGVTIPEGFIIRDIEPTKVAIGWIQGKDTADVCSNAHNQTIQVLNSEGYNCDKMKWCMELYNCPRFTTPDENGEIILDYYIPCDMNWGLLSRSALAKWSGETEVTRNSIIEYKKRYSG